MLSLQEFQSFCLGYSTTAVGVMLKNEVNEGLTYDHANLGRLAGICPRVAASAFINGNFRRSFKHQFACERIWDYLLQIAQRYVIL
jgi:hypothetical protein